MTVVQHAAKSRAQEQVDAGTVEESRELARVFRRAVREAREKNRRLGIANVQVEADGRLTEDLPDGTVRLLTTE